MTTPEKLQVLISLSLTHGSYLALLAMSGFMYFRTKRAGFVFLAVGFLLQLTQSVLIWYASSREGDFVEQLTPLVRLIEWLHLLGLIMLVLGFYQVFFGGRQRQR
ncbi:hypothetical protein [Luteolibacter sp. AS25]|uniref:hypothetical protein n=1 Tax=Luteolibacter sp. AS25 TaxID=3135776 RepID=UPI00398B70E6